MGWRSISCLTSRRGGWWQEADGNKSNVTWGSEGRPHWEEDAWAGVHLEALWGKGIPGRIPQEPCGNMCPRGPGRCGQSSARGSVQKMRSENGERSWREADGTAPHGPLSVLWCTFTSQKGGESWGVLSRGHFRGSPLAAVLRVDCRKARRKQTSLEANVVV